MFTPLFGACGEDHITFAPPNKASSVANPAHYQNGVSLYDVGSSMFGDEGLLTFVLINSIKYIYRYPQKFKGIPDKQLEYLIKARQSLDTAIELHKKVYCDTTPRHG
jgi:hypothetical protein